MKNINECLQEENDQQTNESKPPEAIGREEPKQPIHIPMINNAIGIERTLDIRQIKAI